jgi:hypothetical protein
MKNLTRIAALLITFTSGSAHAGGWGLLGGANFANLSNSSASTKAAFVGGLALEGTMAPGLGIELDGLYATNKTNVSEYKTIQLPVFLRFKLIPMVSLGLGGYFAYGTEEVAGLKRTDAGAAGSLRLHLPLGLATFAVEGRYLMGLTAIAGDSKTQTFQALAGILFGM